MPNSSFCWRSMHLLLWPPRLLCGHYGSTILVVDLSLLKKYVLYFFISNDVFLLFCRGKFFRLPLRCLKCQCWQSLSSPSHREFVLRNTSTHTSNWWVKLAQKVYTGIMQLQNKNILSNLLQCVVIKVNKKIGYFDDVQYFFTVHSFRHFFSIRYMLFFYFCLFGICCTEKKWHISFSFLIKWVRFVFKLHSTVQKP